MIEPTAEQVKIREASDLGLLIVAPAGCGKTEALALRVAGLLERGQIARPQKILVTTFSNRARENVRERLEHYVSPVTLRQRVTVANFHGLSARIFQAHAEVIGMDPTLQIPDSDWVGDQCRSRNLTFDRSATIQDGLRVIKQQALGDGGVDAALADWGDPVAIAIEQLRRAEGRLTYDDLPRLAELILQNPVVADLYHNHFGCLIVDEFQDLTPQQLRIINHIGYRRTTFAGDLAQGIYGFAGAAPEQILAAIRNDVTSEITFAQSHRSSPAVLAVVNALAGLVHGQPLHSADPSRWPQGGLAGAFGLRTVNEEAQWAVDFCSYVLDRAPKQRIGVIARTLSRRRFADEAFSQSGLPHHRWDDPILDSESARVLRNILGRIDLNQMEAANDKLLYLGDLGEVSQIQDPSTRDCLAESIGWAYDLLREGIQPQQIRDRLKVGDGDTLLSTPGVHLLTGHVGKGQQFDWVVIIGAEDGCIPDFRAKTAATLSEEARVFSVMLSRARHGVLVLHSGAVPSLAGVMWSKTPSRFLNCLTNLPECVDRDAVIWWLAKADWTWIAEGERPKPGSTEITSVESKPMPKPGEGWVPVDKIRHKK